MKKAAAIVTNRGGRTCRGDYRPGGHSGGSRLRRRHQTHEDGEK